MILHFPSNGTKPVIAPDKNSAKISSFEAYESSEARTPDGARVIQYGVVNERYARSAE